jgi:uncharacterized cupin superfamily protein
MTQKITVSETGYPEWPLESLGISIVQGDPKGSGQVTFQTGDKLISGGVWGCSPGVFDLTFGWDEMAYLLEGELAIQQKTGETIHLKPGDFFFSPKGTQSRWIITKPVKKVFFLRASEPLG